MEGRVALLTGAGRGIGLAMARVLAEHGCAVAIQDIDIAAAESVVAEIIRAGGKALALGGDIGDLDLPQKLINACLGTFGGLHVLVNNAGIQAKKEWLELTATEIESTWRTNLLAPILLNQLVTPIFQKQQWGRIIHLGSIQGKGGNAEMLPYSISKSGLQTLTTALARELGPDGITVNVIAPGWFDTLRNAGEVPPPEEARKFRFLPLRRIGQPEDCAGVALLLSSDAGGYITGQTIYVDGGMSAR